MSNRILKLPSVFAKRIEGHAVEPLTLSVLNNASQLIGDPTAGLPFFPEFTDHAIPHFQRVLDASASILNNDARKKMTPEDVFVLTAAVVLHDVAMHLKEDGFLQIVTGRWSTSTDWPASWEEFRKEVGRWNARKLTDVLGSSDERTWTSDLAVVAKTPIPLDNADSWTKQQRKLIGEFIRRHHATLAQEFAEFGFPGSGDAIWIIAKRCPHAFLAGFIARSHHLGLRDTFSTLQERYHTRTFCLNTHPVLLMAALRIADYLDVERERAPTMSLALRTIRNPISTKEWNAHQAIDDVRVDEHDSEALFVLASPMDVGTYLRLRELFTAVQKELDLSWAVLGEVFSRQSDLRSVGLSIRRVTSNFDNDQAYRQTVPFIPRRFLFRTAGATLMSKLVSPLYENHIEVGVRELLQNAIDATNELRQLTAGSTRPIRVAVEAKEGGFIFEIEDYGVGMTEDVLHNYFLCAGASFRDSDTWKKDFEVDDVPKIARSGRFGIGVLAAFLLGERITVTTRHYQAAEDQTLTFSGSIDDDFLEIRKTQRQRVGTTITINISEDVHKRLIQSEGLDWDWYRWSFPQIERYIDGKSSLPKVTPVPMPGEDLPDEWHELETRDFESVFWTHGKGAAVVCNGITIGSLASSAGYRRNFTWKNETNRVDLTTPVSRPRVSVVDRYGTFPITLQRFSTIGHAIPFRDELLADVTRDFIAFSLVFAPDQPPRGRGGFWKLAYLNYPGESSGPMISFTPAGPWFYSTNGSGVQHVTSLRNLSPSTVSLVLSLDYRLPLPEVSLRPDSFHFFGAVSLEMMPSRTIPMVLAHALGFNITNLGPHPQFFTASENARVFLNADLARNFAHYADGQVNLSSVKHHSIEGSGIDVLYKMDGAALTLDGLSPQVQEGICRGVFIAVEISNPSVAISTDPIFDETWTAYMVDEIIPYDQAERQGKFKKAYGELDKFIRKWKALQSRGVPYIRELFRTEGPMGEHLRL